MASWVTLASLLGPSAQAETPASVDLALVLAVDVSASMDPEEFALQRAGYVQALTHADFVRAAGTGLHGRIALTYVEWSGAGRQIVVVPWRVIGDDATAHAFAVELAARPIARERGTSISAALAFSAGLFATGGFRADRQVIDISGDGPNNYGPAVTAVRDTLVARGIVINGLPILVRPSPLFPEMDRYYAACVIGGPGAFVMPVTTAEGFAEAIRRKLVREVASRPPRQRIESAAVLPAAAVPPVDCLIGETMRRIYADPYYPGLEN